METPAAEHDIDAQLVERLVGAQHPRFSAPARLVANGWDNVMFRLGDEHVARLPRRTIAATLLENEVAWLPSIAERMPVAVPTPVAVGAPGLGYPWPWYIARWFDGTPVDGTPLSARDAVADDLAAALRALHVPAPASAPPNPVRGVPLVARDAVARARIHDAVLLEAWERGLAAAPYDGPPLWLHGDLHPGNAIIDDGRLAAIIDFGDVCSGDPASDLAAAWLFFGPDGRQRFRDGLEYDDATWLRAAAWAASFASFMLDESEAAARMSAVGRHTLQQLEAADF